MNWFEKHFRKYAIRNLSLVVIICYGFGYILQAVNSSFLNYLTLNPYAIVHGQIWRLVTWVLVPPDSSNIFFVVIAMLFYYSIGTALERTWGTWEYNVYIFSGLVYTVIGSFINMGISYLLYEQLRGNPVIASSFFSSMSVVYSTYYVTMSIALAYAATFPDATVLFMFILPLKMKWLGIAYAVILAYEFITYAIAGQWYVCVAMGASLLNFIIFYLRTRRNNFSRFSPKEMRRKADFRRSVKKTGTSDSQRAENKTGAPSMRPRSKVHHRCAICGRTDADDPTLEFRYCSKCQGNYEFCQDHLFSHIHAANGHGPRPMQQS